LTRDAQRSPGQPIRYTIGNIILGLYRVALLVALLAFDVRAIIEDIDTGLFRVTFAFLRDALVLSGISQELGYALAVGLALPLYLTGIAGALALPPKLLRLLGLLPPDDMSTSAAPSPAEATPAESTSKLPRLSESESDALKKIYDKARSRGQLAVVLVLSLATGMLVYYSARGQEYTTTQSVILISGILYGVVFAYWQTVVFSAKRSLRISQPAWLHSHNHVQWTANALGGTAGVMVAGTVGGVLASVAFLTGHRDLVFNNVIGWTGFGGLVLLALVTGWLASTLAFKVSERRILARKSLA
jgi:hypothetical protein